MTTQQHIELLEECKNWVNYAGKNPPKRNAYRHTALTDELHDRLTQAIEELRKQKIQVEATEKPDGSLAITILHTPNPQKQ